MNLRGGGSNPRSTATIAQEPLFLGNAGTATRFLTAAAALVEGAVTVTGDAHMQKRPIGPLISAMRALGIEVEAPSGCPPVTVLGRGSFDGTRVVIDGGLSSQYVSALLMLAPGARHPVEVALDGDVIGARGYIDLTCAVMRHFGVHVEQKDLRLGSCDRGVLSCYAPCRARRIRRHLSVGCRSAYAGLNRHRDHL